MATAAVMNVDDDDADDFGAVSDGEYLRDHHCPPVKKMKVKSEYCTYVAGRTSFQIKGETRDNHVIGGAMCLSRSHLSSYLRADLEYDLGGGGRTNVSIITVNNFLEGWQYVTLATRFVRDVNFIDFEFNVDEERTLMRDDLYKCSPPEVAEQSRELRLLTGYHTLIGKFGDPMMLSGAEGAVKHDFLQAEVPYVQYFFHSGPVLFKLNVTLAECAKKRTIYPESMYFQYRDSITELAYQGMGDKVDPLFFDIPRQCRRNE